MRRAWSLGSVSCWSVPPLWVFLLSISFTHLLSQLPVTSPTAELTEFPSLLFILTGCVSQASVVLFLLCGSSLKTSWPTTSGEKTSPLTPTLRSQTWEEEESGWAGPLSSWRSALRHNLILAEVDSDGSCYTGCVLPWRSTSVEGRKEANCLSSGCCNKITQALSYPVSWASQQLSWPTSSGSLIYMFIVAPESHPH